MQYLIFLFIISINFLTLAQFDIDNLIGEDKEGISWKYEELCNSENLISSEIKHENDKTKIVLTRQFVDTSICISQDSLLTYNFEIFYDQTTNYSDCVILHTECVTCQDRLLDFIIQNSSYRKWTKLDGKSFISTKWLGSTRIKGKEKQITYLEIQSINDKILLTEKSISKSNWKRMINELKKE